MWLNQDGKVSGGKKKKRIECRISKDGETVKFDRQNFTGSSCAKETAWLEDAFGQVLHRKKKPEYFKKKDVEASIDIDNA